MGDGERDPLEGKRQRVNDERSIDHLVWADRGQGCPVKRGEIFRLKTCHIEITRTLRTRSAGKWIWFAEFTRSYSDSLLWLLDRKGGYTTDPAQALRANDDPKAATLDQLSAEERTPGTPEPPEPEAVPSHEIGTYDLDRQAQLRRQLEREQDQAAFRDQPVGVQLLRLSQLARSRHVDISADERVIERRINAIRRRLDAAA